MTEEIKKAANDWYTRHKTHVDRLKRSSKLAYEPSAEDKRAPGLWKGAHWNWFDQELKKQQLNLF